MAQGNVQAFQACGELEQDLILFYYGDLEGRARRELEAHLPGCPGCSRYLRELRTMLPRTVEPDDPPPEFWESYDREMRSKLQILDERRWSDRWRSWFARPRWALPALAAAAVLALALTFTLDPGGPRRRTPPADEAMIELLPIAENLEFFETMEVLDALDVLESMGNPAT
ncbi:MAG TPA: zf-HC2 domain-containing protein [candidate division Zixibacteria bacterium]|nr:zf-HC2 domain-containing protein [candidate division Zixibacteria bacterium]